MKFPDLLPHGNREEYLELLKKFEHRATNEWKQVWRAQIDWVEGDVESAIDRLKKVIHDASESDLKATARGLAAEIYEETSELKSSLEQYRQAAYEAADPTEARFGEARILNRLGALAEAERQYRSLVDRIDDSHQPWVDWIADEYSELLVDQGRRQEALQIVLRLLRQFPSNQALHLLADRLQS